ncbi:MAG TPA: hypothetical protein VGK58_17835 [Lacipirellulaceae bacterium]
MNGRVDHYDSDYRVGTGPLSKSAIANAAATSQAYGRHDKT